MGHVSVSKGNVPSSVNDFEGNQHNSFDGSAPLLELRNVTKEFVDNNNNCNKILNNINLIINHNEFISIVG